MGIRRGGVGRTLLLPDILELIESLSCLRRVFIRSELWESLQQIVRKCPNTRLFLIRRLHMRSEVQKHVSGIAEISPISPRKHNIGLYSRMRPNRDSGLNAINEELEADILRIIPEVTSGTYVFF